MKLLSLGFGVEINVSESDAFKAAITANLEDIAEIKENFEEVCRSLSLINIDNQGFILKIIEVSQKDYIFLECHIKEGELSFKNYERLKDILNNSVSSFLADFVLNKREEKIIKKIIRSDYTYFSCSERELLTSRVLAALNGRSPEVSGFDTAMRRQVIREELLEYLNSNHQLVLEGFICFRLKDYHQNLAQVVESVVDDFLAEQEYKEFLRVLKYFVDIQPPRIDEIQIIIEGDGIFKVPDAGEKLPLVQYLGNIMAERFNKKDMEFKSGLREFDCQDALISALITIAPNNIMIHSNNFLRDRKVIETIKNLFSGRVITCGGCEVCNFETVVKAAKEETTSFF